MTTRAALVAISILAWACGSDISSPVDCRDGLVVRFRHAFDRTQPFGLHLDADFGILSCTLDPELGPTHECTEQGVHLEFSGDAISGFFLAGRHPSRISVVVTTNVGETLRSTLTPQYSTVEPNGAGREPRCRSAVEEL